MARLVVKIHGQILAELNLQPGQEYFVGRASTCAIVLAQERGISRQHIKIRQQSNMWVASLTSKYGGLIYDGQSVEQIELADQTIFSVPPYEFHFSEIAPQENVQNGTKDKADAIASEGAKAADVDPLAAEPFAKPNALATIDNANQGSGQGAFFSNLDATQIGAVSTIAYVRIYNQVTQTNEVFKLEGHLWTAGRHPSCEIIINDSAISRKHFDISNTPEGYFVTDHGSSNGTKLNNEDIKPKKATPIVSGDTISIRNIKITFEIHDANYQKQLQLAESALASYSARPENEVSHTPDLYEDELFDPHAAPAAVLRLTPGASSRRYKPTPVHIALTVLAFVFLFVLFSKDGKNVTSQTDGSANGSSSSITTAIEDLSLEKRKEVADVFGLAKTYYVQRKYLLCLSQIEKLHGTLPFYENSKELEALCKQARELEQIELDRQRKEEARSEVENIIRKTVEACRARMKPTTTSAEMNICLQPAIELNPQDGFIIDLLNLVQVQENAIRDKQNRLAENKRRLKAGITLYESAVQHYRSGQLKLALKEFNAFINGNYDLSQENLQASRSVASIIKTLDENLREQLNICQTAFDKADLKEAIKSCDAVLKESPENETAKTTKAKAISQLKREMKSIYEDGSLEESMGNIELAKEKWQRILQLSLPEDDYYQKSKQKLKKYGIGM